MKNLVFTLLLCSSSMFLFSQDSTKSASLSISTTFSQVPIIKIVGSDTSYQNAYSLAPAIKFKSKSGLGFRYSPAIVVSGTNPGIYMHTISGGYEKFGIIDLVINFSHFFFSKKRNVPYSPINNELYFSLSYNKAWIQPIFSSSFGFGKNTDTASSSSAYEVGLVFGLSHDFSLEDVGVFNYIDITPSLILNAGTNEYFSFLNTSKYISNTSNFDSYVKKGPKENSSFLTGLGIRNLELNLETSFEIGSFSVRPVGSLFLPISGTDKSMDGYWQVILKYRFD